MVTEVLEKEDKATSKGNKFSVYKFIGVDERGAPVGDKDKPKTISDFNGAVVEEGTHLHTVPGDEFTMPNGVKSRYKNFKVSPAAVQTHASLALLYANIVEIKLALKEK